ncbi:protein hairless [Anastrepha obliqua]|uniref:protein hairless n=1 Tax=Anastrepha obliqua TaxID=95512 RepID=UPI00240A440A|nr:protein hairless [Anastrepha obliqua]XP_054737545.1 protein hairless [Anastrepha obliqua]XP_054737552.1 protein hairless [Anastrepha obliqua]XP_054737561.1 protein hairless [Anastrepha obliqua]XP_054737569.1 protein hairless [Anastrepha obliqua]
MTDEPKRNSLNNDTSIITQSAENGVSGNNIYINNNSDHRPQIQFDSERNERIIVEAAKILFKNTLNGTNAESSPYNILPIIATYQPLPLSPITQSSPLFQPPPPAHTGRYTVQQEQDSGDLLAIASSNRSTARNGAVATSTKTAGTKAVKQTNPSTAFTPLPKTTPLPFDSISATLSKKYTSQQNTDKVMAAAAALGSGCTTSLSAHLVSGVKVSDSGVIDYTMNATSSLSLSDNNNAHSGKDSSDKNEKVSGHSNGGSSNNDIGRNHSSVSSENVGGSFGGRLQFFKNGKVILELARSKEGEKSRWISVPRKIFRAPSATSSTVTPTLVSSLAYSKNESSTSLSFSDDNSSIQSSPWQRDHNWKQLSPRNGISKAMSLCYQRPKSVVLTKPALLLARKKRRRPYDTILSASGMTLFESQKKMVDGKLCSKSIEISEKSQSSCQQERGEIKTEIKKEMIGASKIGNGKLETAFINEEDGCSSSSTATLTGDDCTDARMEDKTPTPTPTSTPQSPCQEEKSMVIRKEIAKTTFGCPKEVTKSADLEKMNTSEDENSISTITDNEGSGSQVNGKTTDISTGTSKIVKTDLKNESISEKYHRRYEKKLQNPKNRLKLNAIVQKLIDKVPERLAQLSRVSQTVATTGVGGANNSLLHKVSPPSTSTPTRLVEFPQQHVSPRKRILREFEKVSLEDTSSVAGGKRSRAKSNASSSSASSFRSIKSPNNRNQCSNNSGSPPGVNSSSSSGNGALRSTVTAYSKSESTHSITTSAPTRLYSSYSIHSLLGGSGGCSNTISTLETTNTGSNKIMNDKGIISGAGYHQQHHLTSSQQHYGDPSYLRAMLASPNSPEQCSLSGGGKSPSTSATKRRSPPYASPLRDAHSVNDIGALNNKTRYASDQGGGLDATSTTHSTSHSNLHSQKQGFYFPYMPLSKYVPSASCSATTTISSISPNSCGTGEARSPRHPSAFSRTSSPASISTNIPVNHSASSSIGNSRENSPPTSRVITDSPRTVPKKTASIRRQFASPTAAAASSGSPSPGERYSEDSYSTQDRRTPVSSTSVCGGASHQIQRSSPSGSTIPSPLQHYYMYPPAAPNGTSSPAPHSSTVSPNTVMPVGPGTTSAAAAVAAAASYIPSVMSPAYMNPYFALAALRHTPQMWSHYGGASLPLHLSSGASSASARLSPPAFHTFAYNGVNAAMAAVMQQQQQQQQILATSALLHGHSLSCGPALPTLHHTVNACSGRLHSPATMTERAADLAVGITTDNATGLGLSQEERSVAAAAPPIYLISSKEEHSSDVPLNLSKH